MGSYCLETDKWYSVTKVGNRFDDNTIKKIQNEIEMFETKKHIKNIPDWCIINKAIIPDFIGNF